MSCTRIGYFAAILVLLLASATARPDQAKQKSPEKSPQQPIAFSHKRHAQQGLECDFCHTNPLPGEAMTIPNASFCMQCHETVATEKPGIRKLAEFEKSGKPIPWARVYSLPAFVFWSHWTHLNASQKCEECHGKIVEMDVVQATNVASMSGCVDCHDKKDLNSGCKTCHESRTS